MLSVAAGGHTLECTRLLIDSKADLTAVDPVGNNVLHIAALHQNHAALDFLLDKWPQGVPIDLAVRNQKGETAFSIANDLKDEKVLNILKKYEQRYGDQTQQVTQDLLEDLMKEEEHKALQKQKLKEKKKNSKLKHIAEKEGLTVEELKAKHQAENEAKAAEEARKRQEEEERVRKELEAVTQEERRRREARVVKEEEQKEVPATKRAPREKSVKFAEEP